MGMDPIENREFDTVTISSRRYQEFIDDIEDLKNEVAKAKQALEECEADRKQFLYDKQCCFADLKKLDERIKFYEREQRRANGEPSG